MHVFMPRTLSLTLRRCARYVAWFGNLHVFFQFLMKYLATYDGASAAELVEVKAAAVKGCIGAVKAPIVSFTEQVQY